MSDATAQGIPTARMAAMNRIADLAQSFDPLLEGKKMHVVCAALALTLVASMKSAEYPDTGLLDRLEELVLQTVVFIGDTPEKERVH